MSESRRDDMMARLTRAVEKVWPDWLALHESVPRTLHHYTTTSGLTGIVGATSLWASDVRYMNDSSELTYAAEVIADEVKAVLSEGLGEALGDDRAQEFVNPFEFPEIVPFAACLCEDGDLLSQWRGYGSSAGAFSLGFDLRAYSEGGMPPNTLLRKVVYSVTEQRAVVRRAVEAWGHAVRAALEEADERRDVYPYPALWVIQNLLLEPHLCFKDPAFREEHEWRLIKLVAAKEEVRARERARREASHQEQRALVRSLGVPIPEFPMPRLERRTEGVEVLFRPGGGGLIPYVELPLADVAGIFTGRLPMKRVVQGPSEHPDLSLESLRLYLESQSYSWPHTDVTKSKVPLRRTTGT